MKTPVLKDFEKWRDLNKGKHFSLIDYIFQVINLNNVPSDMFFAFLELFWPNFVVYKEYIFFGSHFYQEKIDDLINKKQKVEFWTNLLLISPFFENQKDIEERSEYLIKALVKIWQTKLIHDFPEKKFVVEYVFDSENCDYGLTFYQAKNED
jgi:hypothetical protein